ncbi:MAG TPA: 50S ribosomal protein L6 [Sphingomonadales bacterium]|nr:50S ribosomal protein L6 [Sphingomonadales bacterium]
MSRIGKKPIAIPQGVTVEKGASGLSVKGPKGTLTLAINEKVLFALEKNEVKLQPKDGSKFARAAWGMQHSQVRNLFKGVTQGYQKKLEISGVGFRAQLKGKTLNLQLGFSHDVDFPIPEGIKVDCPDQTTVVISGIDKQKVGQVAAEIKAYRKPEPYKGKGIKYAGEFVFRKEGKKK